MAVFPSLGSYGNTDTSAYRRLIRRYDDGTKRNYRRSTFKHHPLTIHFEGVTKAVRDTVQAFLDAREADDAQFTVYNPQETQVLDLTGAATLGKHTADEIIGDTWSWTMDSQCRFSGDVTFFLIN